MSTISREALQSMAAHQGKATKQLETELQLLGITVSEPEAPKTKHPFQLAMAYLPREAREGSSLKTGVKVHLKIGGMATNPEKPVQAGQARAFLSGYLLGRQGVPVDSVVFDVDGNKVSLDVAPFNSLAVTKAASPRKAGEGKTAKS